MKEVVSGFTQQQVDEAMQGIRNTIVGNDMPDTDVLELTEKVDDDIKKQEVSDDAFIDVLDKALGGAKEINEMLKPNVINESQHAMRQLVDVAHKKSSTEKGKHSALEELIIEALKPQLSAWMNDNLPGIVHDIVEKEIKKLVP